MLLPSSSQPVTAALSTSGPLVAAMPLWLPPRPTLRCVWANLPSFATRATLSQLAATPPLSSRTDPYAALSACRIHISARLCRQRRWRDSDEDIVNKRDTSETDDDYINYTARIQPLEHTHAVPFSPTITPISAVVTSTTAITSQVVQLTATPELTTPPPSSAAYRAALFAARDARRAQALLSKSVHSSGPSRRVRHWQSNQKRLRTRADRRRSKYHMNQSYEREEEAKQGFKYPHLRDEQ